MKLLKRIISIAVFSTIALCYAINASADSNPISADIGYSKVPRAGFGETDVNAIRYAAIQEAASSLGARSGLAWQARNIDFALQAESTFIDQVFDFNQLLLDHNVLPPVLSENDDSLNVDNDDTLRIASKTYRILRPARFVTAPPNWRDYLWMRYDRPKVTNRALLPQSPSEAEVWNHYFKKGWVEGIQQANNIFVDDLNRLKRDMIGMILYRKLLAENMVSPPYVAKAQLGITGDATQLRINDQVMRITAQSELQPNPKQWQPILTK